MNVIEVNHISKSFGLSHAVKDVSFEIQKGEIFGLLGPNGAGKTTTIRLMLSIFKPDKGSVSILEGPMTEDKKSRIGYMPEERGLYQDISLESCLVYLATLKGVPEKEVRTRLGKYLDRFNLTDHKGRKVKELSKGMQQKAQIINSLLHQPEVVIIDEPFAGLDPLNVQMVKDLMNEIREQGVTIIMSTHQMHLVEELCDRILLIDKGRDVLYGNLNEIQQRFYGHAVLVRTNGDLPSIKGVREIQKHNSSTKLILDDSATPQDILNILVSRKVLIEKFDIAMPSLDEIFIRVVEGGETK